MSKIKLSIQTKVKISLVTILPLANLDNHAGGLLRIGQAAHMLGVHPNTLRNWELQGKVASIRIGNRRDRRFHRSELLKLLEQPLTTSSSKENSQT